MTRRTSLSRDEAFALTHASDPNSHFTGAAASVWPGTADPPETRGLDRVQIVLLRRAARASQRSDLIFWFLIVVTIVALGVAGASVPADAILLLVSLILAIGVAFRLLYWQLLRWHMRRVLRLAAEVAHA